MTSDFGPPALQMARSLADHYGRARECPVEEHWSKTVWELLAAHVKSAKLTTIWPVVAASWLLDVEQVAAAGQDELTSALTACGVGHTTRIARLLQPLARWWQQADPDVWHVKSSEELLSQLQAAGLSREWSERIVCHVVELPVMPLNRTAIRVVCRHGWLDLQTEYEEWQDWFRRGLGDGEFTLSEISRWLDRIGEEHCGTRPVCGGCPLEPLLPASGPLIGED